MKSDFIFENVFLVVLVRHITEADVDIQDAISGKETRDLGVGVNDLLIGTIKCRPHLQICYSTEIRGTNSHEHCMSRYFEVKVTGVDRGHKSKCLNVELTATSFDYTPELCFNLKDAFWYGGAELQYQRWPIQNTSLPMQAFVTNDIVPLNQSFGNVIKRYWINSKGVGIRADESVRLSVSFNDSINEMCFRAHNKFNVDHTCSEQDEHAALKYAICKSDNIVETYMLFAKAPSGMPDERMFKSPIWSTWAKYKVHIDESKVLQYANEIIEYGFSNSQIEIDDMFSTHYGEFNFTPEKFKNPKAMIQKLKSQGFRVTVWVTPFANIDSPAFIEGLEKGYWLKDLTGEVPALVKWWHGIGGILDVENDKAVEWYIERLLKMKDEFDVDSFKFDAGEVTYIPPIHEYTTQWLDQTAYTTKYVAVVSRLGTMTEVRCGYRSQQYPVFVRMGDKESRWGFDNGLRSLIPTVLTMGILGYPYVLPDMIGGNGYAYSENVINPFIITELPEKELYVRWLELTAYLPAMQFSFVPWQYDNAVVEIARKYVQIHEEVVTPILLAAAREAQKTGAPLIKPLWWIAPKDTDALESETQFLVGDQLLVAPILEQGATERNIYLPDGDWEDNRNGNTIKGGRWLFKYKAELNEVPTFRLRNYESSTQNSVNQWQDTIETGTP